MPLAKNGFKHCTVCDKDLPVSSFHKCSSRLDGLYAICKECRKPKCAGRWKKIRDVQIPKHNEWRLNNLHNVHAQQKVYRDTKPIPEAVRHRVYRRWSKQMIEDLFTGDFGLQLRVVKVDGTFGTAAYRDRKKKEKNA